MRMILFLNSKNNNMLLFLACILVLVESMDIRGSKCIELSSIFWFHAQRRMVWRSFVEFVEIEALHNRYWEIKEDFLWCTTSLAVSVALA